MLTQLSQPATEPLSLAEAKLHLRVDADLTDDDDWIIDEIATARQHAEHLTGRALVSQQWRLGLDCFPDDSLELPKPKLQSVQSVTYLDVDGVRQTLANTEYEVIADELVGRIIPAYGKSWPACRVHPGSVQVSYTCGYGTAANVPNPIKTWMKMVITDRYDNRGSIVVGQPVSELPRRACDSLLDQFYVPGS